MNSIECKYMYCTAFVLKNLNGVLATSYMHKKKSTKDSKGQRPDVRMARGCMEGQI
jgi:hypothetical protein